MSFLVHARTSGREITSQHGSMLAALERALVLAGCGMTEVAVSDHHGRRYTPVELSRKLLEPRSLETTTQTAAGRFAA